MKLRKILFMSFFALFLLSGCNGNTSKNNYEDEIMKYLDEIIPDEITSNIDFPTDYAFEDGEVALIMWTSSNKQTIDDNGKYHQNLFDEEVTLSAEIYISDQTFQYSKVAKAQGKYSSDEYISKIASTIPSVIYKDVELQMSDGTYITQGLSARITYESSDVTVLTNDGKYVTTSTEDKDVTITFHINIAGINLTGSKVVTVEGRNDKAKVDHALTWLEEQFKDYTSDKRVTGDIYLPQTDDRERVQIVWQSSNPEVIDDQGILRTNKTNQTVILTATVKMNDYTGTYEVQLTTFSDDEAIGYVLNLLHKSAIHQTYFKAFNGNEVRYSQDDLGYIHFYVQDIAISEFVISSDQDMNKTHGVGDYNHNVNKLTINDGIIPWTSANRSQVKKTSTQYIVYHDTGDINFDAQEWNHQINTDSREVSWNFTVDDHSIYQHIPLDEVAWHAGDGSREAELLDTGVPYKGKNPEITIGADNFFYINGIKTTIPSPTEGINKPIITESGIYTCAGENGNYYMARTYYNSTYKRVSMQGGNRNGIGIETCINKGVDYNQVMRNTASLIAHLLVYFDLGTDRVMHHRNFSGTMCPQSLIRLERFPEFMNLVEAEYYILKNLGNIELKYISKNPDILTNEGKIIKKVSVPTTVKYDVEATVKGNKKVYSFETIIYPQNKE